ncbi:MAG: TIGR03619 family F420-dependent LLM class oxidoreductase [Nakamurella sp.]
MALLVGAKLPHTGAVDPLTVTDAARSLESAGFDSLWVSDHVVMPGRITSWYPFAEDGVATWPSDTPYLEAVVVLALAAAVTSRVRLGTAILVLPQRNPVLLAKQVATVDAVSGGRFDLGVGAGWLAEEFAALDTSFAGRGTRMETWIEVLRDCWTGRPHARADAYPLADGILVLPATAAPVPVLIGGHSPKALERAGRIGDGWLGQQSVPELDTATLMSEIGTVRSHAERSGRDPAAIRMVLRLVGSLGRHATVAERAEALTATGIDEIIVDVDPFATDLLDIRRTLGGPE